MSDRTCFKAQLHVSKWNNSGRITMYVIHVVSVVKAEMQVFRACPTAMARFGKILDQPLACAIKQVRLVRSVSRKERSQKVFRRTR
jgi:hypothetical protein